MNYEAKKDEGKLMLSLVPTEIVKAIAKVRMFGVLKYTDPDNWKKVEARRYKDALLRHLIEWLDDEDSVDAESGLNHLDHAACNIAFLIQMRQENIQPAESKTCRNCIHMGELDYCYKSASFDGAEKGICEGWEKII